MNRFKKLTLISVGLVVGGGMGNLLDRLFNNGGVVDFMNLGTGDLRTGIFNVADVAIMLGAAILLVGSALLNQPENATDEQPLS